MQTRSNCVLIVFRRSLRQRWSIGNAVADRVGDLWPVLDAGRRLFLGTGHDHHAIRRRLRVHHGGVRVTSGVLEPVGDSADGSAGDAGYFGVDLRQLHSGTIISRSQLPTAGQLDPFGRRAVLV